jgi:hypothetical protein
MAKSANGKTLNRPPTARPWYEGKLKTCQRQILKKSGQVENDPYIKKINSNIRIFNLTFSFSKNAEEKSVDTRLVEATALLACPIVA